MDNLGLKKGDLELIDYNENYSIIFEKEKKALENIFNGKYIKIEHIGSTAIKNIKSKPIIDILVTCKDLKEFIEFTKKYVESSQYTTKEETKSGDFLIRKEEDGKVKAFIHVYPEDNEEAINCIIFRDYLNAHIEEAKKYENLKLELYNKYKSNRPKYTEGKNEYIKAIINKAKNEEYR